MPDSRAPHARLPYRLLTLGGLSLVDSTGAAVGQQRRRLALLALLSVSREQGISRDRLIAVLSPESTAESARHALTQLLYYLRQQCGDDAFVGTDPLRLNPAVIESDLADFEAAIERGDRAGAVALYRGPFLDGFHLDSAEFEEWASAQRSGLAARHGDAMFRLAGDAQASGDHAGALAWWRRLAAIDPLSARAALGLMRAQAATGDASGALRYARTYEALVRSELGAAPDAAVAAFVARVQSGAHVAPAAPATAPAPVAATARLEPSADLGTRSPRPRRVRPAVALGAFAIVAALLTGGWTLRRLRSESVRDTTPMRSTIALPDSAHLAARGRALAISPDGKRVVYVSGPVDSTRLYVRELDRLVATPMPGTEGAQQPFFSPDGEWIGFFAGRDLKKVPANGGPVVTLATLNLPGRGAWAEDGRILVSELEYGTRLSWVPGTGGATQPIASQPKSPAGDMELVDGDRWILHSSSDIARTDEITLSSLGTGRSYAVTTDGLVDRDSVDVTRVIRGSNPRYLRSGHIMYASRDGALMALPFDLARRRVLGTPRPLPDSISVDTYGASFAISRGGTLVYAPGVNGLPTRLVRLDAASGRIDTLPFDAAAYRNPTLSPNGRQLAVGTESPLGVRELFVLDLDRGTQMLVPTGIAGGVAGAGWSPDGSSLMFGGRRQSLTDPSVRETFERAGLRSPDGRHLVILMTGRRVQRDTTRGLVFASIDGSTPDDTIKGPFAFPQFSSDGALISYVDRSSGESEVYVARVAKPRERIKITPHGGWYARWAGARTLTYRLREDWFTVDISTASGLRATGARRVFGGPYAAPNNSWSYDVTRDGRTFLLMLGPPKGTMNQLVVVTNWFAEMSKLAPPR